jgi:hypothetical protein
MTNIHLHNDILIVGASLVIGDPTTLSNLELATLDEFLNLLFLLRGQSGVPHGEEFHLYISEGTIWIHR